MGVLIPISDEDAETLSLPVIRPLTHEEIMENEERFEHAWKSGYFESDASSAEIVHDTAKTIIHGIFDWVAAGFNAIDHLDEKHLDEWKAINLGGAGEAALGYKMIGHGAERVWDRIANEAGSPEDVKSAYKYWKAADEVQGYREDIVKLMAFNPYVGTIYSDEFRGKLMRNEIEVSEDAMLGASMVLDPVNWISMGVAKTSVGAGSKNYLSGAHRQLLDSQMAMVARRGSMESVLNAAKKGTLEASDEMLDGILKNTPKRIADLTEKIEKNSAKMARLSSGRALAMDMELGKLPAGSVEREYLEGILKTSPKARTPAATWLTGGGMFVGGKFVESLGNAAKFITSMPEDLAIAYIMKTSGKTAEEAAQSLGAIQKAGGVIAAGSGGYWLADQLGADELSILGAIGGAVAPTLLSRGGRNLAVYGRQLMQAETTLPYFKRMVSLRPERLTEQMIDVSSTGAFFKSWGRKHFPAGTSQLTPAAHAFTKFIDRTGFGRTLETTGRITDAALKGAALPAGIGYVAGGGSREGFYGGLGGGAVFSFAGGIMGEWGRFRDPGLMRTKQYGDLKFYKENYLSEMDAPAFNNMSRDAQLAVATFASVYPDVQIRFVQKGKHGESGAHWVQEGESFVEINTDSPFALEAIMAHEITHHLEVHGMRDTVHELLLGNHYTGKKGVFTALDEDGKPILIGYEGNPRNPLRYKTNDEFEKFRDKYHEKLTGTTGLKELISTDERIASEIFAEHGAQYFLSPQRWAHMNEGVTAKLMRNLVMQPLVNNVPFFKKAIASLGGSFRNYDIVGTGLFGKFREVPGMSELIKRYDRKLAGLDPDSAKKLIDEDTQSLPFKPEDFRDNPELANLITSGTVFRVDKDGNPIMGHLHTPASARKYDKSFGEALQRIIDKKGDDLPVGHLRNAGDKDNPKWEGRFMSDEVIDELAAIGGWNKEQIAVLRQVNEALREGKGNEFLFHYFKATSRNSKSRYSSFRGEWRTDVPYGVFMSKAGNILFRVMDVNRLVSNIEYIFSRKGFQKDLVRAYGRDLEAGKIQFENDIHTLLLQHQKGIRYEDGILHPDKKNLLFAAFGKGRQESADRNPILQAFPKEGQGKGVWQDRRIDRIGKVQQLGSERPVNYDLLQRNFMPARGAKEAVGTEGKRYMPAAYHGTPHTFKGEEGAPMGRFRSAQIGTGEGNQAYGHGLYFAGKKQVAEHYRKDLSDVENIKVNGRSVKEVADEVSAKWDKLGDLQDKRFDELSLKVTGKTYSELRMGEKSAQSDKQIVAINRLFFQEKEMTKLSKEMETLEDIRSGLDALMRYDQPTLKEVVARMKKNVDLHNLGKKSEYSKEAIKHLENMDYEAAGRLYKVDLAPKENEYLYWDRPLSKQPKGVREKLEKLMEGEEFESFLFGLSKKEVANIRGDEIYHNITGPSYAAASATLLEAGIPGIKYLEGASRAKGKGDYNYVIFDEGDVTITDKLFMPSRSEETVPLPFIEDIGDKSPSAGFRRVVTADKSKGEMEQYLRSTDPEGKNVSQVQPFQPKYPQEKMYMPAMKEKGESGVKWVIFDEATGKTISRHPTNEDAWNVYQEKWYDDPQKTGGRVYGIRKIGDWGIFDRETGDIIKRYPTHEVGFEEYMSRWLDDPQKTGGRTYDLKRIEEGIPAGNLERSTSSFPQEKLYMPNAKNMQQAVRQGENGDVPNAAIEISPSLANKLFMPAAAAYFDPGFSPETYVGKKAFPMMADRMKTGTHVARSGNEFELRGGPKHPDMPINEGKVAWASMDGSQTTQLQNAINRTDGIGLVVLMNEEAVASNRTFARIMIDELKYDLENVPKAARRQPKQIRDAATAVRKWARKHKKKKYYDFKPETLADIEGLYETMSFDARKLFFSRLASQEYKSKGGIFWRDLFRDLIEYKNEDGYRTGDIVKVIQFEQGENTTVNLSELGIPPDPTYDVSFAGKSISNVKGRVSAFQVFKEAFSKMAEEKPGRGISPEGKIGPQAYRSMQMRSLTDPIFTREMPPSSLEAKSYDPIQFQAKTGPERTSLDVRAMENR